MANTNIIPESYKIEKAFHELRFINTYAIREYISQIYNNWKNIYPYFDRANLQYNQDLLDSGNALRKLENELSEGNDIRDKISTLKNNLQKKYTPNVNIYLYNNNKDSRTGGWRHMYEGDIYAYIKTGTSGQTVEKADKNELEPIIITYWTAEKIKYANLSDGNEYEVKKEDYLVLDNHYSVFTPEDCGTTETERFNKFNIKEKHMLRLAFKDRHPPWQRGFRVAHDPITLGRNDLLLPSRWARLSSEDLFPTEEDEYSNHYYNYIYFEEEIKYYLNKTQNEYGLVTSKSPNRSYYRLIYYYNESVKSLDKMFLQAIQLANQGRFYSSHSWWRKWVGGTWSETYFNILRNQYGEIMGDLKTRPLQIIKKLETEFPEEIDKLDKVINDFSLQGNMAENKQIIKELFKTVNEVWNSVREN